MEPTDKYPALEDLLTQISGSDRRETIRAGLCRPAPMGCDKKVHAFRDELSVKEYTISGLCQACQDKIYG